MKRISILGSTGSIGTQTLAVIQQHREQFEVLGLSAAQNMPLLAEQIIEFQPSDVTVSTPAKADELRHLLQQASYGSPITIHTRTEGLITLATLPDIESVIIGIVGFAGLLPTLEALKQGKQVLTANKETFVTAGHLVTPYLHQIVPLDSEHSAIFQCLQGCQNRKIEIKTLYLTASGGPFRNTPVETLSQVTPKQALKHPNWTMGDKVTIDSATMMNKGLEIIEAHHLFQVPLSAIETVIHPQSIIHSAVAFTDGSIIAQLGQPDMRVPLQYGLTYPQRWAAPSADLHLDLTTLGTLEFQPADPQRFPCLELARRAAETGGSLPVVLNAADEVAVQAFLARAIGFTDIPKHIEQMLNLHMPDWIASPTLKDILETDAWTRNQMHSHLMAPLV